MLFVAGGAARTTVPLITINETTTSYYFHRLRQLIYDNSDHLEMFTGEVEVDENYFGRRIKSIRISGLYPESLSVENLFYKKIEFKSFCDKYLNLEFTVLTILQNKVIYILVMRE